ncbi:hypothetical protein A3C96_02020 [Candidatus Uhrbacteria bacterium RIFCSPHIGHO2_02_FULL_60_10]|uniref:Metallo-beta-lactamase domain-containing protein n=1 Tax=Candidatus Uhrbacteria bacterium RIFCSPHIGHO2_02_FULL_60_10 TaxID=1802392 RepID=A0A1F7U7W9_9BACT|nr:MAG: hypothetical protein A3C96_02020 [Candidatus Uhrbacteria bacterium RIFCSPHIGHO2_02_FULL_60_10]
MAKINTDKAVEVAANTYWVGFYDPKANFHCNPYLLVDGDDAIIIDPGSIPHFPTVARKVSSIIKFSRISRIIIHHQDPDLASNITVFEKLINRKDLRVVTTRRVSFLTDFYGFKTPYRMVEEGDLNFGGRNLQFHRTPYLHSPGAFTTYDPKTKTLFSSDIFGAFSEGWDLYAGEDYPEKMWTFHHTYMPPGDILKNQMKEFEKLEMDRICSQHGSVIEKKWVDFNINALKEIKTGGYLQG